MYLSWSCDSFNVFKQILTTNPDRGTETKMLILHLNSQNLMNNYIKSMNNDYIAGMTKNNADARCVKQTPPHLSITTG